MRLSTLVAGFLILASSPYSYGQSTGLQSAAPSRAPAAAQFDAAQEIPLTPLPGGHTWQPLSLDELNFQDEGKAAPRNGKTAEPAEKETVPLAKGEARNEDKMEDIQSFNTWIQLEDGQPGQRGELQINWFNGWQTQSHESDPWLMLNEIEYSPNCPGSWLLQNMKIGLDVPLTMGNGGYDGNGDILPVWKQRLIEEEEGNWWPTFSIENELRVPTGYHSSGVDWTMEGVAAKQLGCGTAVFNGWLKSANGHNNLEQTSWWQRSSEDSDEQLRHFQWGFRTGYKWRITDSFALLGDYINQSSDTTGERNQNIGEIAVEWRVTDHLTIGPGIMFGLDGAETTPRFGAGILVHHSWGD